MEKKQCYSNICLIPLYYWKKQQARREFLCRFGEPSLQTKLCFLITEPVFSFQLLIGYEAAALPYPRTKGNGAVAWKARNAVDGDTR
ncbi:hypothetical protein Pfo_016589 [Paulownia fortunei]|nr:hypothetical protein Pfo_016589 [Paulownia fortunei]